LSHRPEPSDRAVHEGVDGLDIGGQHGGQFVFLPHTHRPQRRPYPLVQAGSETPDTGAEAVKPDPHCSWQSDARRVVTVSGMKVYEVSWYFQSFHIPLMIRPLRRTYVVVVR